MIRYVKKEDYEENRAEAILLLRKQLIRTSVMAFAALIALVMCTVAWMANNNRDKSDGLNIGSEDPEYIKILTEVDGFRHYLPGGEQKDTTYDYTRQSDGSLKNEEDEDNPDPLFEQMLPGEYADVTFRVRMVDNMDGQSYQVTLRELDVGDKPASDAEAESSKGWFKLDQINISTGEVISTHYYNVLPIFKYEVVSVIAYTSSDETDGGTNITKNASYITSAVTEFQYFDSYTANTDSSVPEGSYTLMEGVWNKEWDHISIKYRVQADFDPFYTLLKETGSNISNLLTDKSFSIGKIRVDTED